ncbi:MAG: hypothetical protein AAGI03_00695 [Pseudomonadota bacterium]
MSIQEITNQAESAVALMAAGFPWSAITTGDDAAVFWIIRNNGLMSPDEMRAAGLTQAHRA